MEAAHNYITGRMVKMNKHLVEFASLDAEREEAIELACNQARSGAPIDVSVINLITSQINEHAKHGISPTRLYVTEEMIKEYINR